MSDQGYIHPVFLPQEDLQSDLQTNLNLPSTVSNDIYERTISNYCGELAEPDLEQPYPRAIVNFRLHGQRAPASRFRLPESPHPAKRSRVFRSRETLLTEARQLLDKADDTVIAWVVDQLKNRNHSFQQDESDGGHLYSGDSMGIFDNAPMSAQLDTAMDFTYPQDFGYDPELLQQAQQPSLSWNPTASPHHARSNLQRNPSSMLSSYNNGNFDVKRESIRSSRSSESSLFDPSIRSKHSSATTISSFASSMASVDHQSGSVYGSNRNTIPARSTIRSGLSNITNVSSDNKLKPDTPYECTIHPCRSRFKQKGDWKRHEASRCAPQQLYTCNLDLQSTLNSQPCPTHPNTLMTLEHLRDAHSSHACPQSTRTPTRDGGSRFGLGSRSRNRFENTRLDKLRDHLSDGHRLPLKKVPSAWISDTQGKQTEWGCGFCGAYLRTWDERANHIGDHFAGDGKTMEEWNEALAEQGLLRGRGRVGMAGGRRGGAEFTVLTEIPEEEHFKRQTARLSLELKGVRIEDEHTEEDKELFD